jgi:LacI family transcriptional regulator
MARLDRTIENVTIIDVAREAGVSYATVSRVINNKAHVKPEKRDAVLGAMSRLGYVVNQQARSLAGGRSRVIGLLVQNLGSSWMGAIVRGIDEELSAAEYDLMLYTTHRISIRETTYVATLTRGMADGLLLVLPRDPASYLESLRHQQFPFVLIDHQGIDDSGPLVGVTNWEGAHGAMRYLLELGHQRIGFITGNLDMASARDRLAGYYAALSEHGLPNDPALVIQGDFSRKSGFLGAQALLGFVERPTAIFASNDESAFGVMEAARDYHFQIPRDLSVVGFDDIAESATVHPPLTTVRQPLEQMGRIAARMLLQAIDDPNLPPERVTLATELIIRQSCQALQRSSSGL